MATIFPEIFTDGTGRTWTWSEQWGGYRSEGMVTHGYDTIKNQWGIAPECCDGTGWTGNPRERCTEHYEPHGLGEFGFIGVSY